eukprot:CFRG7843T1
MSHTKDDNHVVLKSSTFSDNPPQSKMSHTPPRIQKTDVNAFSFEIENDTSDTDDWTDEDGDVYRTCPSTPISCLPGTPSSFPMESIPTLNPSSSVHDNIIPGVNDTLSLPSLPHQHVRRVSEDFDDAMAEMKGVLHVEVIDAQGLPQQWMRSRVTYVVISIGLQIYRTSVHKARLADPVWQQELRFLLNEINTIYDMTFSVYKKKKKFGHASINIKEVLDELISQSGCYKDFFLPLVQDTVATATDKDMRGQMKENYEPKYHVAGLLLRMRYLPKEDVEKTFLDSLLTYFNTDDNSVSTGDCLALLDQLGIIMTEYQFERWWRSIAPEGATEIAVEDFMGALNKLSFQESGVMQRLMSYIDFGEEFLHHYVLGGFLSVEDASNNYHLHNDNTFSRNVNPADSFNPRKLLVMNRETGTIIEEFVPGYIMNALSLMYRTRWGRSAVSTSAQVRKTLKTMSEREGAKMNSPESCFNIKGFVALHNIAIHEVEKPLEEFRTFNEFFSRRLKAGARKDAAPGNSKVALCCADSRLMAFQTWQHSRKLWVKGTQFDFKSLVGPELQFLNPYFDNASLCIARLAPQDYHRWHMPVTGKYVGETFVDGQYYTVNPIAIRSEGFNVFTENKRVISQFLTEEFGLVLLVSVGATLVGSLEIFPKVGQDVTKFDEHGTFYFGGSTVIVVFQEGVIDMDTDLLTTSMRSMETLVRVGQSLGVSTGKEAGLNSKNYSDVAMKAGLQNLVL